MYNFVCILVYFPQNTYIIYQRQRTFVLILIGHHSAKVYWMKLILSYEMKGICEIRWKYLDYYDLCQIMYSYNYSFMNIPYYQMIQ